MKRILTMMMACLLMWGVCGVAVADEVGYVPNDPYVLHFGTDVNDIWVYAQFSPFVPKLTYDGGEVDGYSIIFGMHNNVTGQSFDSLYCTDMPVDADDTGANYRPINLEDSTYAAAFAGKLRGIVLSTYPRLTVEQLAAASGIDGLTRGEAITASQLAIWKTAHGNNVQIVDFLASVTSGNSRNSDVQLELNAERDAYISGDDAHKAAVKGRIEQLYRYLMALPAANATVKVVSDSSIVDKSDEPVVVENSDGTCNVTVKATVDVSVDGMVLTAYMADGKYCASVDIARGRNEYTLTISNVPGDVARGSVSIAIDGEQNFDEIYLVDAEGIRGTSQSMIGVVAGILPVHAETVAEPDRIFKLVKTETTSSAPLAGISFEVYYVGSLADYHAGTLGIGDTPTDADITRYAKSTNLVGTLTTGSNGRAEMNFGTVDAVYLVKELPNDKVVEPVAPFFVVLPGAAKVDGGDPTYVLTASLQNTAKDNKGAQEQTGGISLLKVDSNDESKVLPGAVFELYRKATDAEIADGAATNISVAAGDSLPMVQVRFYTDSALTGDAVTQVTTGADGTAGIYGIADGEYYLLEVQAPDGYNRAANAIKVVMSADNRQGSVTIANGAGVELPATGGVGTTIFVVAGLALIGGAMWLWRRRACAR